MKKHQRDNSNKFSIFPPWNIKYLAKLFICVLSGVKSDNYTTTLRCKIQNMTSKEEPKYQTPPTCDLLSLLLKNRRPTGAVNEVWPNLYIGDAAAAKDKTLLVKLEITHVVNAADGHQHIDTGPGFYKDANILYHGVEAPDCKDFDLSPFFTETADFIHGALSQKGKVLIHCARGISRSAALVLAFLVIKERLTLVEAVEIVCRHRNILPNVGFLNQLRGLDSSLLMQRRM